MTDNRWMLKLLSGVHIGAELMLEQKSYTLGRSADNDIVIHDSTLGEHSLVIECGEEITLQRQDETIEFFCQGRPVSDTEVTVKPYDVFTLGTLHFCFGLQGEPWPAIHIPTLQYGAAPANATGNPAGEQEKAAPAAAGKNIFSRLHQRLKVMTAKTLWLSATAAAGLLLCGLTVTSDERTESAGQSAPATAAPDIATTEAQNGSPALQKLETLLYEQLALNDLTIEETPANGQQQFRLKGYLKKSAEKNRLQRELDALNLDYKISVKIIDKLIAAAESIVERNVGGQVRITAAEEAGYLTLSGAIADEQLWSQTKEQLQRDVPGLMGLEDNVLLPADKVELVISWAKEQGIDADVEVLPYQDKILVKADGALANDLTWKEVVARYQEKFGEKETLVLVPRQNPNLPIQGISFGRNPYIVMQDGNKYTVGAQLKSGFTLDKITADTIQLSRAGKSIEYHIAR